MVDEDKTIADTPGGAPTPTTKGSTGRTSRLSSAVRVPDEVQPLLEDAEYSLNQYVLVKQVGAGGMGSVWKAWDTKLARWVAVKFLSAPEPESIRRFEREAQLAAQLRHPNIAGVHEVNEARGFHYLVMDFVDGPSILKAPFDGKALLDAFVKVCRAIDFAHQKGIIHRDIKPGNILVGSDGQPYVTDFGLAKVMEGDSSLSVSGAVLGTPSYMSPEQAAGRTREVDARSDVYSLGATLYHLLLGRRPFEAENSSRLLYEIIYNEPTPPRKVKPELPAPLEAVILKALEKDLSRRYASAGEIADDLERHLRAEPVEARAPGAVTKLRRRIARKPWPWAVGTLLVIGGAAVALLWPRRGPTPVPTPTPEVRSDRAWRDRFDAIRGKLDYYGFSTGSSELVSAARAVLAEVPSTATEDVAAWFEEQAGKPSAESWPKQSWLDRQADARRIREWSSMMEAILEGSVARFDTARARFAAVGTRFAPVAAYRGKITLRLIAWPYAELRSLRVGEEWLVRDGKIAGGDAEFGVDGLATPLVIRGLDIGDYALTLARPGAAEGEVRLEGKDLKHGGTYVCSGPLDRPDGFVLRPGP